jgi:hypothetical protein
MIYIGKNLHEKKGSEDEWFFQDAGSYLEHGSFIDLPKEKKRDVFIMDKDSISLICDLDGLMSDLNKIKAGIYGKRPKDL